MSNDNFFSNDSPEMQIDDFDLSNWNGDCFNCEYYTEDDDDVMGIFYMAEVWSPDNK